MGQTVESEQKQFIWHYIIGALLIFTGIAGVCVLRLVNFYERFVVPGVHTFHAGAPGQFTIFHEYVSDFAGGNYDTKEKIGGLACNINQRPGGKPIPVDPVGIGRPYKIRGNRGEVLWSFEVTEPGDYSIHVGYRDYVNATPANVNSASATKAVLAIGNVKHPVYIINAYVIFLACALFGCVAIYVAVERHINCGGGHSS
jgi:hypothetical protein